MTYTPRVVVSTAFAALLAACAMPLQPDRAATAPELPGYGNLRWNISTAQPTAQRLFTQGVLQAYAFNEVEAVRMFKAALAHDPTCALCAWGVAWQLGPTINDNSRTKVAEALRYLNHAMRHASQATAHERALIEALALRYGHATQARETAPLMAEVCSTKGAGEDDEYEPPHPLDVAYAARLRQLVAASPNDPDLLSLYAEAEVIATTTDWWNDDTGQPGGRMGEVTRLLEQALVQHVDHTGLNHYLVHAADAAPTAHRAVAAADRLGRLAPAAPHLVHMPSHIYVRVGRYADATRVNQEAVAADLALFETQRKQGFDLSKDWRNHDQHFLWFAALMQGRGDVAVATARDLASRSSGDNPFHEYRRSLVALSLLRMERWDALLAEPLPGGGRGMSQALGEGARGVALVRQGRLADAHAALAKAEMGGAMVSKAHTKAKGFDRRLREMVTATTDRLRAEIASAEGRHDDALTLQAQALAAAKRADQSEPPMLAAGARLALGDLQLRAGRVAQAESTFRADLTVHAGSGWALSGLARALQAQGRTADALVVAEQLSQAWSAADAALTAKR